MPGLEKVLYEVPDMSPGPADTAEASGSDLQPSSPGVRPGFSGGHQPITGTGESESEPQGSGTGPGDEKASIDAITQDGPGPASDVSQTEGEVVSPEKGEGVSRTEDNEQETARPGTEDTGEPPATKEQEKAGEPGEDEELGDLEIAGVDDQEFDWSGIEFEETDDV
jgi:hypothetical protein